MLAVVHDMLHVLFRVCIVIIGLSSYRFWFIPIQQRKTQIRNVVHVVLFGWEVQALATRQNLVTSSPLSNTRWVGLEYVNVRFFQYLQLGGAVEACGAHMNMRHPKVDGSKPSWATFFSHKFGISLQLMACHISWPSSSPFYNSEISLNYLLYSYTWMSEWFLWCLHARVFVVAKR